MAALDFGWLMVLPFTVLLFSGGRAAIVFPAAAGALLELARLFTRQRVRRELRLAFMLRAARQALWKDAAIPEVRSDSAFWGAHIAEYAVSVDLPVIFGAGLATLAALGLAVSRTGFGLVFQVGSVLFLAVVLGILSSRLRSRGVDAIVDRRQYAATWMAAAVRDRGELASPRATAAFLMAVGEAAGHWCAAEESVERQRIHHRFVVVGLAVAALYAIARRHGIDPFAQGATHTEFSGSLTGAALVGTCLPAAYTLATHLDSLAIAHSELKRLALNLTQRTLNAGIELSQAPRLLRFRELTAHHGTHLALDVGNLDVPLTGPVGVAGPNGSGKTTLAAVVAGLHDPTTGTVLLGQVPAGDANRNDVAFVPQDPVLIEGLSVVENLRLVAAECDLDQARELLQALGLVCSLDGPAGSLSRGEQQRIAIARALLKRPKLLVLDEPDAWLDIEGRRALMDTLEAAAHDSSVLVVSHRPDVLLRFETVIVLSAMHQVESIDDPRRLREYSPTFRALFDGDAP